MCDMVVTFAISIIGILGPILIDANFILMVMIWYFAFSLILMIL